VPVQVLLLAAGEPSKVPFYIAGIVLVLWAVALSGLGLSRSDFPGSQGATRGVMAITVALVAIAIAMAVHTSAFIHS
jgi:hypothetical protein